MKILLLGKNGQIGWELQRSLATLGKVFALGREFEGDLRGDLSKIDLLIRTIRAISPDVIVNAAAYTAVDKAESDKANASLINVEAVKTLAQESARLGALLVHYSTDYVFDGSGERPWRETDPVAPLNYYGQTKLLGELEIQAAGCDHLIFRTCWVYAARGANFARTMLRLASERSELHVIDDQVGAPTGADLIADVTAHAIRQSINKRGAFGTYHLAASGFASWYEYANLVIKLGRHHNLNFGDVKITPVATEHYPTPAQRPLNSRLCTDNLRRTFSVELPAWQDGVARMIKEVLEK
ncbi:dTDP-4-dehydrorhamnose reductase [Pseudomonas sp. Z2-11]